MVGVDTDQLRIGGFVCAQKGGHPFIEAALHGVKDADRYDSDHGSTCSASLLSGGLEHGRSQRGRHDIAQPLG